MCTYSLVPITLISVARGVIELLELSVCRIAKVSLLIAKITSIIHMIDTIITHQHIPTMLAHYWLAPTNLYFFQIVKEQKQPMIVKRSNLNQIHNRLRFDILVEVDGIEPTTPCLQSRCSPS